MKLDETVDLGKQGNVRFEFEDTSTHAIFENITQSYGLCFNQAGYICIVRSTAFYENRWILPGGTIEEGETPEDALHRELMEEADLVIGKYKLLGGQVCTFLDYPKKSKISQLRYAAIITEIQTQTPDPDNGVIPERKFVKPDELNTYLNWGSIGDHLAKSAKEWFDSRK